MGIFYDNSLVDFLIVTIALGGGAAWMTGRAVARGWQPMWVALLYMVPLAAAARFLHFALYKGTLLSLHFYIVDLLILSALAALSYRIALTDRMITQYPWLYERSSPVSWREK